MEQREIKFRGKRKDNGQWVYGNLFVPNKLIAGIWICPETTYGDLCPGLEEGDNIKDYEYNGITLGHFHEVIPETTGQYTGFKDKNGKEIYEGDILHCHEYDSSNIGHGIVQTFENAVVGFYQGAYYYFPKGNMNMPHQLLMYAYQPKIIGNIHENSELINQ